MKKYYTYANDYGRVGIFYPFPFNIIFRLTMGIRSYLLNHGKFDKNNYLTGLPKTICLALHRFEKKFNYMKEERIKWKSAKKV